MVEKHVKEIENGWKKHFKKAEIQNISNHGIWILIKKQEYFMPFDNFPWFLKATVQQIYNLNFFMVIISIGQI